MESKKNNQEVKLTPFGRFFHRLGLFFLNRTFGQQLALLFRAFVSLFSKNRDFKTDSKSIILQAFFTGVEIFPFLFIVATLFGTVVIVEVFTLMGKVGFSDVVGSLMVVVIVRELGPILTAFLIAGRSGSSLASYIGGMVINSEVDALATMGINPIRYLVMPSLIGGTIATFMMTIIFSVSAVTAGFFMTKLSFLFTGAINIKLTWDYLVTEILSAMTFMDFIFVVVKPLIFGSIITINACYQALSIPQDIREVPQATSKSVIKSFLYIVIADVLLSFFYFLDYMNEVSNVI